MVESNPIQTPFMTNCKLSKDMGLQNDANLEVMWVIPFQNVIKSLMYAIICIIPNIAYETPPSSLINSTASLR
jgi:hypothetical protein